MSKKIPVSQVRLTNIAIVRCRIKGQRFEIACFPNKVLDWRKKIEKDIGRVLQSTTIFKNVGKGEVARRKDLLDCFGTNDQQVILEHILEKGQLQVSEKERQQELSNKQKEIVVAVASMCVNSETKQPISTRMIDHALQQVSFNVNLTQNTKSQAMRLIRILQEVLPIERVKMKVLVSCPSQYSKDIKNYLSQLPDCQVLQITNTGHSVEFITIIDPGILRTITEACSDRTSGVSDVSVLELNAENDVDGDGDGDDSLLNTGEGQSMPGARRNDLDIAAIHHVNQQIESGEAIHRGTSGGGGDDEGSYDVPGSDDDDDDIITPLPTVIDSNHPTQSRRHHYDNDDDDDDDDDISAILSKYDTGIKVLSAEEAATGSSSRVIFSQPRSEAASSITPSEMSRGAGSSRRVQFHHTDADPDEFLHNDSDHEQQDDNQSSAAARSQLVITDRNAFLRLYDDDQEDQNPMYTEDLDVLLMIRRMANKKGSNDDYEYIFESQVVTE